MSALEDVWGQKQRNKNLTQGAVNNHAHCTDFSVTVNTEFKLIKYIFYI